LGNYGELRRRGGVSEKSNRARVNLLGELPHSGKNSRKKKKIWQFCTSSSKSANQGDLLGSNGQKESLHVCTLNTGRARG